MKKLLLLMLLPVAAFAIYDMKWLDGNNWLCPFYNDGRWGLDVTVGGGEAGGSWPRPLLNKYVFGAGFWLGCRASSDTLVTVAYNPNSGGTEMTPSLVRYWREGRNDSLDRIYKYPGDWPPPISRFPMAPQDPIGDMTLWSCFCDSAPENHLDSGRPLGVDMALTVFLFEDSVARDFFFLKCEVFNSCGSTLADLFFGPIVDHDIGLHSDDMVGLILDEEFEVGGRRFRVRNTGFGYDYDNMEQPNARQQWEQGTPGAVAVKLLGTAPGRDLAAFKKMTIDIDPVRDPDQYLTLAGFDYRTGVYAPFDSIDVQPADKRFLLSSGPFALEPESCAVFWYAVIASPFGDSGEVGPKHDTSELALRCFWADSLFGVLRSGMSPGPGTHVPGPGLVVYPSPFRTQTTIMLGVEPAAETRVTIVDALGRVVRSLRARRGRATLTWDGRDDQGNPVRAGAYFVRVDGAGFSGRQRLLVVR